MSQEKRYQVQYRKNGELYALTDLTAAEVLPRWREVRLMDEAPELYEIMPQGFLLFVIPMTERWTEVMTPPPPVPSAQAPAP